jgi:hypothetical protein
MSGDTRRPDPRRPWNIALVLLVGEIEAEADMRGAAEIGIILYRASLLCRLFIKKEGRGTDATTPPDAATTWDAAIVLLSCLKERPRFATLELRKHQVCSH